MAPHPHPHPSYFSDVNNRTSVMPEQFFTFIEQIEVENNCHIWAKEIVAVFPITS